MNTDLTSLIAEHLNNGCADPDCFGPDETPRRGWLELSPNAPDDYSIDERLIHHLAAVIEASDWLREQRARELEATAEAIDRRARVVERRHVAEALRNRARAIREGRA